MGDRSGHLDLGKRDEGSGEARDRRRGRGSRAARVGDTVRTWNGETLSKVPVDALEERFGLNVILRRPELQKVLLAVLPDGTVQLCAGYAGFRQNRSGVTVFLRDRREERGDLLVGADGLNSTVRRRLFDQGRPRYAGFTAWRGLADLGHRYEGEASETWGRGKVFGLVSLDPVLGYEV